MRTLPAEPVSTEPPSFQPGDLDPGNRQLRVIVLVDLWVTTGATVAVLGLSWVLPPSPVYPLVIALPAAAGVVMAQALRPLRRGDVAAAVGWLSVANWGVALAVAAVVTFLWPLMLLVAILPCVLAVSFLPERSVRVYVAVSLVVAVAVAVLGLLQDITGFSEVVPTMVRDVLLIVVTPFIAVLIGLVSLFHRERLQRALAAAIASSKALEAQATELRGSRARVVAAADQERRRIEQDLHDGAQQRLVALKMRVTQAATQCANDPVAAQATLEEIRGEVAAAHRELRDLAQGVYPPVLVEHGLAEALRSAADRCPVPVVLDLREPIARVAPTAEATLYFCAVEALQNAAKHGGVNVTVTLSAGSGPQAIWVEMADDGVGFDPGEVAAGTGLRNLRDRLGAVGGELHLSAAAGRGVVVRGKIPLTEGPVDVLDRPGRSGAVG